MGIFFSKNPRISFPVNMSPKVLGYHDAVFSGTGITHDSYAGSLVYRVQ